MVLLALIINSIKLGEGSICTRNVAISEETPNLAQGHREGFFTLCGLKFLGIDFVPVFQV